MKRNWFYTLSPCIIAAILTGLFLIGFCITHPERWHTIEMKLGIPLLVTLTGLDVMVKWAIEKKIMLLWMVELLLLTGVYVGFKRMFDLSKEPATYVSPLAVK